MLETIGLKLTKEMSDSRKGDFAEYYAVTWLWDQGYEVFVNAGSDGMVDMIAWHPDTGETILIDVKTVRSTKNDKDHYRKTRTLAPKERNDCLLLYNADTRELRFVEHKDEQSD